MTKSSQTLLSEERQWWLMMKAGNPAALERVFRRYYQHLYDYGMRFYPQDDLVKDSLQDVFATIWERRLSLGDVEAVLPYLLAALRRNLLRRLTHQRKTVAFNADKHVSRDSFAFSPEEFLIYQEAQSGQKMMVQTILESIPPRMREALYLKIFKELAYADISKVMGISEQVARNYVFEALQRLRQLNLNPSFQL